MDAIMKNTKEKREAAFMKIAWDVLKMKQMKIRYFGVGR